MCERQSAHHSVLTRGKWRVNREVIKVVCKDLFAVSGQLDICLSRPALYRSDGVHLFELKMEIFLRDLQRGLRSEVIGLEGMGDNKASPIAVVSSAE